MTENTTKVPYAQLNEADKKARVEEINADNAKHGVKEGLFRIVNAKRTDETNANGKVARYGFRAVPVKGYVDEKDFKPDTFVWLNQLVSLENPNTKIVLDKMDDIVTTLAPKDKKSVLVSVYYKRNAKGYLNPTAIYKRDKAVAKAQA